MRIKTTLSGALASLTIKCAHSLSQDVSNLPADALGSVLNASVLPLDGQRFSFQWAIKHTKPVQTCFILLRGKRDREARRAHMAEGGWESTSSACSCASSFISDRVAHPLPAQSDTQHVPAQSQRRETRPVANPTCAHTIAAVPNSQHFVPSSQILSQTPSNSGSTVPKCRSKPIEPCLALKGHM